MKQKLFIYWPTGMELFTVALACSLDTSDPTKLLALHFDPAQWGAMLLSPFFLLCAFFTTVGMWKLHQVWKTGEPFSDTDKFAMVWFLMNATWYHTGCDVMSGLFQVMPNLRDAYAISNAAHDFPMHDLHRIGLDVVYWLELLIQVPLCVVVIWLYARRSPARPVVEAFLCALHFAGTWAYYLPSILMGETNNVIISNIDRTVATAWVIVPGLLAWRAMKQVVAATEANKAHAAMSCSGRGREFGGGLCDLRAFPYPDDMPYDISGWIETTYMTPDVRAEVFAMGDEDACRWRATVCLDGLALMGDASSDLLFGLVRQPSGKGLFVDRGLPPDVSLPVLRVYEEDQGQPDGLFGYTYATLAEVQSVRWHEHGVALNESVWWSHIVCLMDDLSEMEMFDAERVRIVVWANW